MYTIIKKSLNIETFFNIYTVQLLMLFDLYSLFLEVVVTSRKEA